MSVATPDRPALETYRFDLGREEVFRLEEAASRLPSRRSGRPVSRNALYGWTKGGIKANDGTRVRLPYVRVAGSRCTSMGALSWFFTRLGRGAEPAE